MVCHCFNDSFLDIVVSTLLILFLIVIDLHDVDISIGILSNAISYISFENLNFYFDFSQIIIFLLKVNFTLLLISYLDLLALFTIFALHYTLFFGDFILHFQDIALCLLYKPISFFRLIFSYEKGVIDDLHQFFSLGLF